MSTKPCAFCTLPCRGDFCTVECEANYYETTVEVILTERAKVTVKVSADQYLHTLGALGTMWTNNLPETYMVVTQEYPMYLTKLYCPKSYR